MVDIIDLALIGQDGVTFGGGFGTSNNVGIAFQMSLLFGTQVIVAQLMYWNSSQIISSTILYPLLHLSSTLGN